MKASGGTSVSSSRDAVGVLAVSRKNLCRLWSHSARPRIQFQYGTDVIALTEHRADGRRVRGSGGRI